MSIRHILGARSLQDFRFRLHFDPAENSRERNAHQHTGELYLGAHPAEKIVAFTVFISPDLSRDVGTDTSHWDRNVDEAASKAAGIDFTLIKAMDGTVETKYYRANRARAKEAGLIQGPYAWLYPNKFIACKTQAQALFALLSSVGFDELPPSIDWEWTTYAGQIANPNIDDLQRWTDEWLRLSSIKPILYTAPGYANQFGVMPASLREKFAGLWAANYGVRVPGLPPGWVKWDLHQFTSSGDASVYAPNDAGKKEVDLNYTFDELTLFRLTGGAVPLPETGETMSKYYRWTAEAANVRVGPGASYAGKGFLRTNDVIQVDAAKSGSWYPFKVAQKSDGSWVTLADGTKLDGSGAVTYWVTDAYFVQVTGLPNPGTQPQPEPEPPPPSDEYVLHVKDGVTRKFVPE